MTENQKTLPIGDAQERALSLREKVAKGMVPPRPKFSDIDFDKLYRAAALQCYEHCVNEEEVDWNEVECMKENIKSCAAMEWGDDCNIDGYRIMYELQSLFGWDGDYFMVEILHDMNGHASLMHGDLVKDWISNHLAESPIPKKDDRVSFHFRGEVRSGNVMFFSEGKAVCCVKIDIGNEKHDAWFIPLEDIHL